MSNNTIGGLTLRSARRTVLVTFLLVVALLGVSTTNAAASSTLRVTTLQPEFVTAGKGLSIFLSIQNTGTDPLAGDITATYTFPAGIAPKEPIAIFSEFGPDQSVPCQTIGQEVKCVADLTGVASGSQYRWETSTTVDPDATGTLTGQVEVSGGGTPDDVVVPMSFTVGPSDPFSVKTFDLAMTDAPTVPAEQAGSDPLELRSDFSFPSEARTNLIEPQGIVTAPSESMKDVVAHVPPGFVGNPTATPLRCTATQLVTPITFGFGDTTVIPTCPPASQVGLVQVNGTDIVPLWNMVPAKGAPAQFGFYFLTLGINLQAKIRPSDNGIDLVSRNTSSSAPISKVSVFMWGVPGDPSHNQLRGLCLDKGHGYNPTLGDCSLKTERVPFLRTPTSCTGSPLDWGIEISTYQHPDTFHQASTTTPAIEGCQSNPFDPDISLTPSDRSAQAPSGLDVELKLPQDNGPDGLAEADLRAADVTLPQGVTINPASADGLQACSDQQLRLGLEGPSQCPDGSKLGSVEVDTPLLDEAIGGSVFLRSQASNDPASGDMYRLAIELRSDERGVAIKLPGSLRVDPSTGQLKTSFGNLPQLPFESMRLHFKTGPRAPLTTPSTCGTYSTQAELTSWSGKTVSSEPSFTLDQACDHSPFAPGFQAGAKNNTAGAFSPFLLRITRDSGQPNLSRIEATLPEGELAKLAGVPVCGDRLASAGTCPAGSRIGSVVTAIGEGSSPLYLPQAGKSPTSVYLAAPYKGAPYSVVTEVPAQAGPFDLGKVLVRSALRVDPETTQVSVVSDPLPQIFGGIPVAYRDVRVQVDRPEFTVNPTDCEPSAVTGTIASAAGGSAAVSDRFQVADCAHLGFKPKLSLQLKGTAHRGGNPALTAVLTMPQKGRGANIARAVVTLPGSEFIAQDHLNNVCTRVQYAANGGGGAGCPKGAVYGRARAFSPMLDRPLEGPVYLRSNGGDRELPDLVASLDGPLHVDLVGYVDSDKRTGGLRTTFARIPDAAVSKFVLKMGAGKKSLLENSVNICHGRRRAIARFDGQNGKINDFQPLVRVACGQGARKR